MMFPQWNRYYFINIYWRTLPGVFQQIASLQHHPAREHLRRRSGWERSVQLPLRLSNWFRRFDFPEKRAELGRAQLSRSTTNEIFTLARYSTIRSPSTFAVHPFR